MKTYICEYCSIVFRREPSSGKNRFCSVECYYKSLRNQVEITCINCSKVFMVNPYRQDTAKYCSQKCKNEYHHSLLTCRYCGQTIHVRSHIINSGKYKGFCSPECANKYNRGENHYNWQGGFIKSRGCNWWIQRNAVRKRDNYTCQECGIAEDDIGKELDIHHIIPYKDFNGNFRKANRLDNLISLCPSCHTETEAYDNR